MKYIKKNLKNEPQSLRLYRNTTENPVFNGGNFDKKAVQTALMTEQGYLCAYCMGRISSDLNEQYKPKIEIEHFESQELFPQKQLLYQNMLGVCNGLSATYPEPEQETFHHCDKTKGQEGKMNGKVQLRKLDPRSPSCEQLVFYTKLGEIRAVNDDLDVKHDLEKVLNLNNKALMNARKGVFENALQKLQKEKPTQEWNRAFLEKHIEAWQSKEKVIIKNEEQWHYRRYCMIAVWFLKSLLSKPKYNH